MSTTSLYYCKLFPIFISLHVFITIAQGFQLSQIIRETPEFEAFLPVSRLESEISRMIAEVCHFFVDSTFWQLNFKYFALFELLLTSNVSSQNPVCHCNVSNNVRKSRRVFRLPTSDFRLPTSDFRLKTSYFKLQTSDLTKFELRISDFWPLRLNAAWLDFWPPTSHFLLPTSHFWLPTCHFPLPISDFRFPTSDFPLQLPTSDFPLPTWTPLSGSIAARSATLVLILKVKAQ